MGMFKVGDSVTLIELPFDVRNREITVGKSYTVQPGSTGGSAYVINNYGANWHIDTRYLVLDKPKGSNMLESAKEYLKENKSIIMTIAVVLIVDHLVFGGAFREKVKALVNGLLDKAQTDLDKK